MHSWFSVQRRLEKKWIKTCYKNGLKHSSFQITLEAIKRIMAQEWRKNVQHIEKEITEAKERGMILDK